VLRDVVESVE
jgi:hypothetical protein